MKQSDELCYTSRQERDKILTPQTTTLIQLISGFFSFSLPDVDSNQTMDNYLYHIIQRFLKMYLTTVLRGTIKG